VQTNNIAAVETLAAVNAIKAAPKNKKIMIVSDSLITVKIIQQYGTAWIYTNNAKDYYKKIRAQLIELLHTRHVEAVWVASDNSNVTHLEVDNLAKTMLDHFLKGVRL
jgi:ribonuclease HI